MTERFSGRTLALVAMLIAVVSFSTSSSLIKWSESTGSVVAFWRMIGAVIGWWTSCFVLTATGAPAAARRAAAWRTACCSAGLFFGANIALFFTAITKTSIAHAEFIGAMTPLVLLPSRGADVPGAAELAGAAMGRGVHRRRRARAVLRSRRAGRRRSAATC